MFQEELSTILLNLGLEKKNCKVERIYPFRKEWRHWVGDQEEERVGSGSRGAETESPSALTQAPICWVLKESVICVPRLCWGEGASFQVKWFTELLPQSTVLKVWRIRLNWGAVSKTGGNSDNHIWVKCKACMLCLFLLSSSHLFSIKATWWSLEEHWCAVYMFAFNVVLSVKLWFFFLKINQT